MGVIYTTEGCGVDGGAVYWSGDEGVIDNCSFIDNIAIRASAIYWSGFNGNIFRTEFRGNGNGPSCFVGASHSYKCIDGLMCGFYTGDLIGDSFILNASVNSKINLTFNKSVLYNDYLIVKVLDDNSLPYYNNTLKVHIFNKDCDEYLEALIDDKGFAKIKLPSNLTKGEYNISYSLKIVQGSYIKSGLSEGRDIYGIKDIVTYEYAEVPICNSSLSVLKSNVFLSSFGLSCFYDSNKYLSVKLVDNNGVNIGNFSVLFKVYIGKSKYKSYNVRTGSDGVAVLKHKFKPGKYSVVISSNNPNYNVGSMKTVMKISKIPTITKAFKRTNKYHKKAYFKVKILNKTNEPISNLKIKVKVYNGKKYKVYTLKTNSKGLAYLNTKNLKEGRHKVVISSANDIFAVNKSSCIVIKK